MVTSVIASSSGDRRPYKPGPAEQRYSTLESDRDPFLRRAQDCARYTIPTLYKSISQMSTDSSPIVTPWQSVGADGVNGLSAKLMLILFPPGHSFWRQKMDPWQLKKQAMEAGIEGDELKKLEAEIDGGLREVEDAFMSDFEGQHHRPRLHEAITHLVVGGNICMYIPKEGPIRVYSLERYVCKRDEEGNPFEILIKEMLSPQTLPEDIKEALKGDGSLSESDKEIAVYTHIVRKDKQWVWHQEVRGLRVPDSDGTAPLDAPAWLPLRALEVSGEDYGRSYVELALGDLKTLDGLTQSIAEMAFLASRKVNLVRPGAVTKPSKLNTLPNGGYTAGEEGDIFVHEFENVQGFQAAASFAERLEERLSRFFLVGSAFTRNAERVTAEEIRWLQQQLEDKLGGVYSILTQELQLPMVRRMMKTMEARGKLPKITRKDLVKPVIITGVEALGRGHDRTKLESWLQACAALIPGFEGLLKGRETAQDLAKHGGVDGERYLKSEEQLAQEAQQAQAQAMLENPSVVAGVKAAAPQMMEQGMGAMGGEAQPEA